MSEYRIEYGERETTERGFVDGVDTGDPVGPFRTFEQGAPRYFIDGKQVDHDAFIAALDAEPEPELVERRHYAPSEER